MQKKKINVKKHAQTRRHQDLHLIRSPRNHFLSRKRRPVQQKDASSDLWFICYFCVDIAGINEWHDNMCDII